MPTTAFIVDCELEDVLDRRIGGDLPHPDLGELADEDDEWDPIDLELRAEESAFQDAYERGLIFA